jgi:hypothetical protein
MAENTWVRHKDDGQKVTKRSNGRRRVQTINKSESRTVQSDVARAEIKNILRKYEQTGIIDHMRNVDMAFRDITEFTDLSDALRQAKEAEGRFMQLPPQLRNVFENDVAQWLDAAHDGFSDDQRAALQRLGLIEAPEPPAPEPVVAEPPATAD